MKLPKRFFLKQKKIGKLENQGTGPAGTPQAVIARPGGAPPWLVGSLGHLRPSTFTYKFPKIPEKIRRSSKVLFRRRKLLSPQDPIWARSGALSEGIFGYGGLLHQHHDLSDDA